MVSLEPVRGALPSQDDWVVNRGWKTHLLEKKVPCGDLPQCWVYQVSDFGDSLSEISERFYFNSKQWREIAEWNQIKSPYWLKWRQLIVLRNEPNLAKPIIVPESKVAVVASSKSEPTPPVLVSTANDEIANGDAEDIEEDDDEFSDQDESDFVLTQADHLEQAIEHFDNEDFEIAFTEFRTIRTLDPEMVSSWVYEIKALQNLKRKVEAGEVADELELKWPRMHDLVSLLGVR